jgi:hypothetical protein
MLITLDSEDIESLRSIRSSSSNEIAFLLSNDSIITFEGDYDRIDIPMCNSIIGHSHPHNMISDYNPPSKADFIGSIKIPNQDWFVVDELGIWVYSCNIPKLSQPIINYIAHRFDLAAIGIMNGKLTVDQYLRSINRCVLLDKTLQGVSIAFYKYGTITSICLRTSPIEQSQ